MRLRAYTRRKGKREGERGRETKGERKAAGLVKYRSEWQVRDKSSGSGTSFRSAAIVWKGECRFLARIGTLAGTLRCPLFSSTYVGPPSGKVAPGSAYKSHDRTRLAFQPITYRRACQDRSREKRGGRTSGESSRSVAVFRLFRRTTLISLFLASFFPPSLLSSFLSFLRVDSRHRSRDFRSKLRSHRLPRRGERARGRAIATPPTLRFAFPSRLHHHFTQSPSFHAATSTRGCDF